MFRAEFVIRAFVVFSATVLSALTSAAANGASVDGEGALRWRDGREVAVMGVNYYPPFWGDFRILTDRGIDIRRTIDDDIQHFRRLGLDCLRLHAIDREISTKEGALVDNEHLAVLDYLLASAISNGMHVVLTPIAWFSGPRDGEPKGFSQHYAKEALCSDPALEPVVTRYLREFVSHVNRHTGVRYADEPGIVAFECFNEPRYARGFSDERLTAHVTRLADAIRSTGTDKPVFYSVWQGRTAAIAAGRVDGLTVSSYPNDIQHGCETEPPSYARIRALASLTNAAAASKAKIAYEFDSADTCCSDMIPVIARMFRSVGVQAAAMFQYDELPLAAENAATRTHYLNLVYTPGKAIGMAIAAEVFRRVPRGVGFVPATDELAFPPFRTSRPRACAELAADDCYFYTNGAMTPPPDPAKLRHVWGVGDSPVVTTTGTGAYFLDRLSAGRWRLQLYPDVFRTADPFTGKAGMKVAALDRPVTLTVGLPDLGARFTRTLAPGDYVVARGGAVSSAPADLGGPRFVLPELVSTPLLDPRVPRQMRADRSTDVPCATVFASSAELTFSNGRGDVVRIPVEKGVGRVPAGALAPGRWYVRAEAEGPAGRAVRPTASDHRAVWHPQAGAAEVPILPESGEVLFESPGRRLPMGRRALPPQTAPEVWKAVVANEGGELAKVETGFVFPDGRGFGTVLVAPPGESLAYVQPESVVPLWRGPDDWTNRWGDVRQFSTYSGQWLFGSGKAPERQRVRVRELARVKAGRGWPVDVLAGPADWNFFDPERYANAWLFGSNQAQQGLGRDGCGDATYRLKFDAFVGGKGSFTLRQPLDGAAFRAAFPEAAAPTAVVVRMRALTDHTRRIEFVLYDAEERPWGVTIPLTTAWRDIRVSVEKMKFFRHWTQLAPPPKGAVLDARGATRCAFTLGAWLFKDGPELPHEIEISAIRVR